MNTHQFNKNKGFNTTSQTLKVELNWLREYLELSLVHFHWLHRLETYWSKLNFCDLEFIWTGYHEWIWIEILYQWIWIIIWSPFLVWEYDLSCRCTDCYENNSQPVTTIKQTLTNSCDHPHPHQEEQTGRLKGQDGVPRDFSMGGISLYISWHKI